MTATQALELKWYGAGCLTLEENNSVVIVDPFVSRPSLLTVLTNQELFSNKSLVQSAFGRFKEVKDVTVLITHNHYDHVLDLPELMELLPQATIYGPKNTKNLLETNNLNKERFNVATEEQQIKVGATTITPFLVEHSNLPLGLKFAHGKMNNKIKLPMGAFDYKAIKSLSYYIEYPTGTTLIHPTTNTRNYPFNKVDNLIVGLTSRNIEKLKEKIIQKINHKKIVTIHNDNFFKPINEPIAKMPFYPTLGKDLQGTFPKTFELAKSNVADKKEETKNESN